MTHVDAINAAFEGGGAIFLCLNVRRLLADKSVKGVSLVTTAWWSAWGFWNVYFYSAVGTPASFYAGIAVVCVNVVWLGLALYFRAAEQRGRLPRPPRVPVIALDGRRNRRIESKAALDLERDALARRPARREVLGRRCRECGGILFHGPECKHV